MHALKWKWMSTALIAALCTTATATPALPPAKATDAVSAETTIKETRPVSSTAAQAQAHADTSASADLNATSASATALAVNASSNWWKDTDTDGDGKISVKEAKTNAGLDARFSAIDSDKDGFVKLEEYRAYFESNVGKTPR